MKERNYIDKGFMLFAFFFKIGCFTFGGGWSILAQMEQEFVEKRNMITKQELLELTAVGKSVPGIMITNISMLFGYQVGGWFGGVCAVCGIAAPAIIILSVVTLGYSALKDNQWCFAMLKGIRAAVVPIMGSAALSLGKEAFKKKSAWFIFVPAFLLCMFTDLSNMLLICICIAVGLVWVVIRSKEKKAW